MPKPECTNDHITHKNYPASKWLSVIQLDNGSYHCTCCDKPVLPDSKNISWGQLHHIIGGKNDNYMD